MQQAPEYELCFEYLNIAKDNQEKGKLAEFKETLLEYIKTTDTKIPSSYCLMRERINRTFEKENYVQKDDIIKIIEDIKKEDKGISSVKNEDILKNLHALAFCFWFDKVEGANTVVLNPRWITGAVYRIINWVKNAEPYNNAAIDISKFGEALRTSPEDIALFPLDKDRLIFNIMKQFELAYSENGKNLIIPHCLKDSYPDNEVGLRFNFDNTVQAEIRIERKSDAPIPEFPTSLVPRFIVKKFILIYKNERGNSITSKKQAMFSRSNGGSFAEIKLVDNYRVYITVQGINETITINDNILWLRELVADFGQILLEHNRFQEKKPTLAYRATDISGEPLYLPIKELKKYIDKEQINEEQTLVSGESPRINQVFYTFVLEGGMTMRDTYYGDVNQATGHGAINYAKADNHSEAKAIQNINAVSQEFLKEFIKEISEAKERINALTDLEHEHKEMLIKLMNDTQTAMQNGDDHALEECKSGFNNFKKWASKAANVVLPVLANLATIAPFFGIPSV